MLRLKLRGDGSVALRLRAKFGADVDGVARKGRFHLRLDGAPEGAR